MLSEWLTDWLTDWLTWCGGHCQHDVVAKESEGLVPSLQGWLYDVQWQPHHQILPGRPAQLQAGADQPVDRGHHEVKEQVGAIDVEGDQAPRQEGDLYQLWELSVELGGQRQVQEGRQGENNPALHPAWE